MSAFKQILLSLVVVLIAAAGWYAYDKGYLFAKQGGANVAQSPGGAGAGGRPGAGGGPGGSRGGAGGGQTLVVTAEVAMDDAGMEVRAIGTVAAARAVTLFAQVTGIVVEAPFTPGSQVEEGRTLIRLDDADQRVAVDKARIARDAAQAALDRAEQLAKSNNITTVALSDAKSALQRAGIDLQSAENDLAKRTIKAPFAGTVGLSDVTVGDLVNSSKAIVTLDDMTKVTVSFVVPERASGLVAVGQPVTATSEAVPGQAFNGEISAVDSRVDPTARTLKVEATLPNDLNILKPGMALAVGLSFPGEKHPEVPSLAVQWDRSGPYVWKLVGDKVERTSVQILGRRSGAAIVSGELALGDEVIIEGLQRLRDGATVTKADDSGNSGGPQGPRPGGGQPPTAGQAPGSTTTTPPEAGADARPRRPQSG